METLEYLWLVDQVRALQGMKSQVKNALKNKPDDFRLMSDMKKVDNDLGILKPPLVEYHKQMIKRYEEQGNKFQLINDL